jgi:hypothetical protein
MEEKKPKFWNIEIMVGIMATIVSLCALIVSVTQTRIMREQQYAQVWPNLTYGVWKTNTFPDSTAEFEFHLNNKGVGPAIIKDVKMVYKGEIFEDQDRYRLFQKMIKDTSQILFGFGSVEKNKVMLAGEDHTMWGFGRSKNTHKIINEIWTSRHEGYLDIVICYQNIYGKTWILHNGNETEECKNCTEMQKYFKPKKN